MSLLGRSSGVWRTRAATGALLASLPALAAPGVDKRPIRVSFQFGEATLEQRCDPKQAMDIEASIGRILEEKFPVWRFPVKPEPLAPSLRFQLLLEDHRWFLQLEAFDRDDAAVAELRTLIPAPTRDPDVTAGRSPRCSQLPAMVARALQENWLKPENAPQVSRKLYRAFPVGGPENVTRLEPPPEEHRIQARLLLVLSPRDCCRLAASSFAIITTFSREEIKLSSKGLGKPEDVQGPPGACAITVRHLGMDRPGGSVTFSLESLSVGHAEVLSQLVPVLVFLVEPDRSRSCGEPIAEAAP